MAYIKNNKVLVFIIAMLLLSNIAMLYFYLNRCKSSEPPKKQSTRGYIVEKLRKEVGFTDEQIARYEEMSNKHKQTMKPLFEDIRLVKDSFYALLPVQPSDSLFKHHLSLIGNRQEAIDQRIFNHFYALKAICTAEQRPRYDSVIQKVIEGMINPSKKK